MATAGLPTSRDLDRRITFRAQQALPAPAAGGPANPNFMKAGKEAWGDVATVWAQVQEMLPSRAERLVEGLVIARRPARIRIRWRADITSKMQIVYGARTLEIMTPPIELGRREWLEMMAQDLSSQGKPA